MARTLRETLSLSRREVMNLPDFDWARPRRARRWLVAAYILLSLTAGTVFGLVIGFKSLWLLAGFILMMPVFFVVIGSLNASIRGVAEIRTAELDEWQRAKRDAMFRACWWPGIILLTGVAFVAAMTPAPVGVKAGLPMGGYFLALCMPLCALAWTLPEDPEP